MPTKTTLTLLLPTSILAGILLVYQLFSNLSHRYVKAFQITSQYFVWKVTQTQQKYQNFYKAYETFWWSFFYIPWSNKSECWVFRVYIPFAFVCRWKLFLFFVKPVQNFQFSARRVELLMFFCEINHFTLNLYSAIKRNTCQLISRNISIFPNVPLFFREAFFYEIQNGGMEQSRKMISDLTIFFSNRKL